MINSDSVWKRTQTDGQLLPVQVYNLAIGLTLLWGFAINYITVQSIPVENIIALPTWGLLIGYFVSCFIGVYMYQSSDNPAVSFLGYNFVVLPVGVVLSPFLVQFDPGLIVEAMIMTSAFTGTMMCLSVLYPAFFLSIGRTLGISLLAVIALELGAMFFFGANPSIFDWIVAVIFCGYIGFDWARANAIPKTLDNAIDSAASLYLDIINLFIRILSIMGRRR